MPATNKVNFGLESVYYSIITDDGNGNLTYATPVAIKGAVDLNLEQQGEMTQFFADNCLYFTTTSNTGYSGTVEFATIPDTFLTGVLGYQTDTDGAVYEKADAQPKEFALLYEVAGDAHKSRRIFYRCKCTRPAQTAHTTEAATNPNTVTLNITAMPVLSNRAVKAKCVETDTCYAGWFSSVHVIA